MLLNKVEKLLMNNPVREATQRYYTRPSSSANWAALRLGVGCSKLDAGGAVGAGRSCQWLCW